MKLLIDTHALIWWWMDETRLPAKASDALASGGASVFVSIASVWEIAIKHGLGKLDLDPRIVVGLRSGDALESFEELEISRRHVVEAGALEHHHGDPFDRLLIAQARLEGLTIVSNEKLFDSYGVSRLWK